MAKLKGKGVVLAGLVAGAASFLSKKENRDKAMEYINKAKGKVNEQGGLQGVMEKVQSKVGGNTNTNGNFKDDLDTNIAKSASVGKEEYTEETLEDVATTAADVADTALEGNQMVEEGGAQATIYHFNEEQEKQS